MGRNYSHSATLKDGKRVGYTLKQRGGEGSWFAYFKGPDGSRYEKSTKQANMKAAHEVVPDLLAEVYQPQARTMKVTWEEAWESAEKAMKGENLRPRTIQTYRDTLEVFRKASPSVKAPWEVMPYHVKQFKIGRMDSGRSPFTVAKDLRCLDSLWGKWFIEACGFNLDNPFSRVPKPKTDKREKRVLSKAEEQAFFAWVEGRFPGFRLPRLFFETKAAIGCRILELAGLRSEQLQGGRILFPADETKGREARTCKLSPGLFQELQALAGPVYLWEGYTSGLRALYQAKGGRFKRHALNLVSFAPMRLVRFMQALVTEYCDLMEKAQPGFKRFHSHNLRGTAMSRAVERLEGNYQAASIAFDCHPDTMRAYYVQVDRQRIADMVFDKLQEA